MSLFNNYFNNIAIIERPRSLRVSLISHSAHSPRMTGSQIRFKMVSTLHIRPNRIQCVIPCLLAKIFFYLDDRSFECRIARYPPLPPFLFPLVALLAMPNPYLMHHTCASILILVSTWPASRIFLVNREPRRSCKGLVMRGVGWRVGGGGTRGFVMIRAKISSAFSSLDLCDQPIRPTAAARLLFIVIVIALVITLIRHSIIAAELPIIRSHLTCPRGYQRARIIMKPFSRRNSMPTYPINPIFAVTIGR